MKNIKKVLFALLVFMIQTSCSEEQQIDQPKEATLERPETLTILFDDAEENEFSDEDKKLITNIIIQSEKEVNSNRSARSFFPNATFLEILPLQSLR